MKLIVCIVQNQDSRRLADEFVENGVRATRLSSTGGFLRSGNTTFLIRTEDRRVNRVIEIIRENCSTRNQTIMTPPSYDFTMESDLTYPLNIEVGGATVFVMDVEQFHQL